jgi:hypothetical protein
MKAAGNLSYWQKCHLEHVKNHVAKGVMDFNMINGGDNVPAAGNLFHTMQHFDEEYLQNKQKKKDV